MNSKWKIISIVFVLVVLAAFLLLRGSEDEWICERGEWKKHGNPSSQQPDYPCGSDQSVSDDNSNQFYGKKDLIIVEEPAPGGYISSPLSIKGSARGFWFFEASFPVKLYNQEGDLISSGVAQAQDDWMSEDFVPFTAELEFTNPGYEKGEIVFEKDNPSGLLENYDEFRMPVLFNALSRKINLYYYNPSFDKDESVNIMCSKQGIVAVEREIPLTKTHI